MPVVGNLDDYLEMIKLQSLWIHFYRFLETGYFLSFNNSIFIFFIFDQLIESKYNKKMKDGMRASQKLRL